MLVVLVLMRFLNHLGNDTKVVDSQNQLGVADDTYMAKWIFEPLGRAYHMQ